MNRMQELVRQLNEASKAYYAEDREIMSNLEYDELYDELSALEKETGTVLANSPTIRVGYEAVSELEKETHESPMLSLDKTKDIETMRAFIDGQRTLLSWKMDGLTIVLTYREGRLAKAVTRGNGVVGEVVTNNARVFQNIPLAIPYTGELILRGEAIITYSDFEKINQTIEDVDAKYKNPRNLCSGSVRQLNNEITAGRNVQFYAFALVRADDIDFHNSREQQFLWLQSQGFQTVEYRVVSSASLDEAMHYFAEHISQNDFPSDGLVALFDDIAYGDSLGHTAKFPRNAFAFKWADEKRATTLREIEWSPSRTGLINPVAIFDPVELEGTTVSRASVHNISIMRNLKLGIGDTITVYKANMIIPQIAENLTASGTLVIPDQCPVCGGEARIMKDNGVETLNCMNPDCQAKKLRAFEHFVARDAMNIDGMSEATLEKFIGCGFIHDFGDIFELERYRDEIVTMDGFGARSYEKLIEGINAARHTTLPRLLFGLGIPNVGLANAKLICKDYAYDFNRIRQAAEEELASIDNIGPVIAGTFTEYFSREENNAIVDHVLAQVEVDQPEKTDTILEGKTFVITGNVQHFENRSALKEYIEARGGTVSGSVSARTSYLINNEATSNSSKNKKAKDLGIPILSEDEFLKLIM